MKTVNVHAAKTNFSRLLDEVAAGEDVIIAKAGSPVARLSRFEPTCRPDRRLGALEGIAVVPDDFDAPLPEDVLATFEGG